MVGKYLLPHALSFCFTDVGGSGVAILCEWLVGVPNARLDGRKEEFGEKGSVTSFVVCKRGRLGR